MNRAKKERLRAKEEQRKKKQEKISERNARQKLLDDGLTVRVTCQAICGCCEAVFYFKSRERAEAACKKANLKHATVTDDRGESEQVDGFYGFNIEDV